MWVVRRVRWAVRSRQKPVGADRGGSAWAGRACGAACARWAWCCSRCWSSRRRRLRRRYSVPARPGWAIPSSRSPATAATMSRITRWSSRYDPATRQFDGTATITATAIQNLSRFDLDLRGFDIDRLTVNGAAASFTRDGQELVITPAAGLSAGAVFTVVVGYAGVPSVVTDPDGSIEGWVPTDDGAFVVGEPQGSPAWYPANDNPRDKATYDFTATVPAGITVMANGVLGSRTTTGGRTTWVWRGDVADGAVPGDGDAGSLRPHPVHGAGRDPGLRGGGPDTARPATCSGSCRTSSTSMPRSTGRTRSRRSVRSSTTPPRSVTRWRHRPSRSSIGCRTRRRWRTSSRTCGTGTR